jgi:hypothetical protein
MVIGKKLRSWIAGTILLRMEVLYFLHFCGGGWWLMMWNGMAFQVFFSSCFFLCEWVWYLIASYLGIFVW